MYSFLAMKRHLYKGDKKLWQDQSPPINLGSIACVYFLDKGVIDWQHSLCNRTQIKWACSYICAIQPRLIGWDGTFPAKGLNRHAAKHAKGKLTQSKVGYLFQKETCPINPQRLLLQKTSKEPHYVIEMLNFILTARNVCVQMGLSVQFRYEQWNALRA